MLFVAGLAHEAMATNAEISIAIVLLIIFYRLYSTIKTL